MNNKIILLLAALLFVGAYFGGRLLQLPGDVEHATPTHNMDYASCNPAQQSCLTHINNQKLQFRFMQHPSGLTPFAGVLQTRLPLQEVYVSFSMRGMDMGFNRFSLQQNPSGDWVANMLLPVCSLGRNDWMVELWVKYQDAYWRAQFEFEQRVD